MRIVVLPAHPLVEHAGDAWLFTTSEPITSILTVTLAVNVVISPNDTTTSTLVLAVIVDVDALLPFRITPAFEQEYDVRESDVMSRDDPSSNSSITVNVATVAKLTGAAANASPVGTMVPLLLVTVAPVTAGKIMAIHGCPVNTAEPHSIHETFTKLLL